VESALTQELSSATAKVKLYMAIEVEVVAVQAENMNMDGTCSSGCWLEGVPVVVGTEPLVLNVEQKT
jgi:hypothetical protein